MADIQVIKLKVRRGLDSQRRLVVLDEGELGYTIDTQRLFVGTGTLSGGLAAAPKIHQPLTNFNDVSALNPEKGDLVYADNKLYQYTLTSWTFIGSQVDDGYVEYDVDNQLTVALNSIDGTRLNQQTLSSTSVTFNGNTLVVNYNTAQFAISGTQFALNSNAIKPIHIDTSCVSRGLAGGNGVPLSAYVDNTTIGYDASNRLTVKSYPVSAIGYDKLSGGFVVDQITNRVSTAIRGVDSTNFALCGGNVTLQGGFSSRVELPLFTVNDAGLVRGVASSIFDILSSNNTGILSAFNGSPDQVLAGYTPTNGVTILTVLSSSQDGITSTLGLSSAGFIVFEGGSSARNNVFHTPGRFAIPVFTF